MELWADDLESMWLPYSCGMKKVIMASSVNRGAMAVSGLTAGDERMVLLGADREAFLAALLNPPEPTEELVAALRRHRSTLG
jgi:hypothetical protein